MNRILSIAVLSILTACAKKADILCTKRYENSHFGVTIFYSDNWNDPYEFFGSNIGMEYSGVTNFQRRYDAEIIITMYGQGTSESEFYKMNSTNELKQRITESMGGSIESKIVDEGVANFANRRWTTLALEESGSIQGERYNSIQTNYLWYSKQQPIAIKVTVRGQGEIEGLDAEVDCILSNLQIKDFNLTARNE